MPCRSDYMEASAAEVMASRLLMILEELKTGVRVNDMPEKYWRGYHPEIYNKCTYDLSALTAEVCGKLRQMKPEDIHLCSLEVQTFWRDHQIADVRHAAEDARRAHLAEVKANALQKLDDEEKKALGVKA